MIYGGVLCAALPLPRHINHAKENKICKKLAFAAENEVWSIQIRRNTSRGPYFEVWSAGFLV
jgi:hypothetical protein